MSVAKYPNAKPISNRKTIRGNLLCLFFMPALYLVSLICQLAVEKLVLRWDTYRLRHDDLTDTVADTANCGPFAGNEHDAVTNAFETLHELNLFHVA
jgi:hypothetical protein